MVDAQREAVAMGALIYYFLIGFLSTGVFGAKSAFDQDLYKNVLNSEQCQQQLMFLVNDTLRNSCELYNDFSCLFLAGRYFKNSNNTTLKGLKKLKALQTNITGFRQNKFNIQQNKKLKSFCSLMNKHAEIFSSFYNFT